MIKRALKQKGKTTLQPPRIFYVKKAENNSLETSVPAVN